MNELAQLGRRRTILISISILLVSLHTIYFYQSALPEINTSKLIQQSIRFILTVILLIFVFQAKRWARIIAIILFSLALLGAVIGLLAISGAFINKIPILVMIFIYAMAIHHLGFSNSYKAYFNYKNSIK
ncbi:hypothetical protein FNJ87_14795 [Nonlabens mediterrranea]|uniref:Uncharacterized protein n=1 Tax=Nonlabens mediterrranea TaxID=1419947 RepID=A0ABS0A882_9FLAO|nr:hypothetical protein BBFL7_00384 [Flavobacteria bacterium BBFL7]MBF4985540.1 hypothetical protein [Nonlabens mediterrranea]